MRLTAIQLFTIYNMSTTNIIYVVCNTAYTDHQFICAFTEFNDASWYAVNKCGDYDTYTIFKHVLNSKELGEMVYIQDTSTKRIR